MNNMNLLNNSGLDITQLLRKRDLLKQLIDLGYDLTPELSSVLQAINDYVKKENGNEI